MRSVKGNVKYASSTLDGITDKHYCLSFRDTSNTCINFQSNITNIDFLTKLLFTGELKEIYTDVSRNVPGQKLMIRSFGDEQARVEVIIKDDLFGEIFHQTYNID